MRDHRLFSLGETCGDAPPADAQRRDRLPEPIERALCEILGAEVREVRIVANSRYARLHLGAVATTRRGRILLRGSLERFSANPELLLHEYFHVIRQWAPRRLSILRYLVECARHGYHRNRFEVEAREFAERNRERFVALIAAQGRPAA